MEGMEEMSLPSSQKVHSSSLWSACTHLGPRRMRKRKRGWLTSRSLRKVPRLLPTGGGLMTIVSTSVKKGGGAGEMVQQKTWVHFPAPLWQLATISNCRFRAPDVLIRPPGTLAMQVVCRHTCRQEAGSHPCIWSEGRRISQRRPQLQSTVNCLA